MRPFLGTFLIVAGLFMSKPLVATTMEPDVTLTLDPEDGQLSGSTGDIVGWGFTLTTDSDYILIESFSFGDLTPVGTFTSFDGPLAAASAMSPLTAPFDDSDRTGIGSYLITSPTAGSSTTGLISATYDVWDSDPNSDPNAMNLGFGLQVFATDANGSEVNAEVEVLGGSGPTTVPEPVSLPVIAAISALLIVGTRLKESRIRP